MGRRGEWLHTLSRTLYIFISNLQYLGSVPDLGNWESPATRSEFMDLVDSGQVCY